MTFVYDETYVREIIRQRDALATLLKQAKELLQLILKDTQDFEGAACYSHLSEQVNAFLR